MVKLSFLPPFLACASAALALALPLVAHASDRFLAVLPAAELAEAPSQRYALMSRDEALTALRERGVIFDELPPSSAPGVVAPVRLTSRLRGVFFHGGESEAARARSPLETLDARLALALDDFAAILQRHDIVEVLHFSMYRPGGGRPTRRAVPHRAISAHPPGKGHGAPALPAAHGVHRTAFLGAPLLLPRHAAHAADAAIPSAGQTTSRHPAGLAIDVAALRKSDGTWLNVESDFHGHIGAQTCGEGAPSPKAPEAQELRAIVCEATDRKIFTYVLTPNYNQPHHNHFHMEIKGGVPWVLVH